MRPALVEHGRIWNFAWRYETVSNQRRLGRGLEALLGRASALEIPTPTVGSTPTPISPDQSGFFGCLGSSSHTSYPRGSRRSSFYDSGYGREHRER